MIGPGPRFKAHGQDLNDALGNLAPFAEDTTTLLQILERDTTRRAAPDPQHRQRLRRAHRARGQLRELIANSNRVFETHRRARPRAAGDVPRAADLPARVAQDARRVTAFAEQHEPAGHPAAAGARAAVADAAQLETLAPDLRETCSATRPADHGLEEGHAGDVGSS
jgi:ABC-type transporter Mla subunit MlaD